MLKIEPQADTSQNVTMFPVLVRIPNSDGLLKPGMNAEVKINVGRADQVIAVPNAALRTERDVESAASVLGISEGDLATMLEAAKAAAAPAGGAARDTARSDTITRSGASPSGQRDTSAQRAARTGNDTSRGRAAGGQSNGGQQMGGQQGGNGRQGGNGMRRGGNTGRFIVFALRDGKPTPVYVTTGITDLDYTEVKSGLAVGDSVLMLPSASLIQSQRTLQERMGRNAGLPGQAPGAGTQTGGAARRP